jgi:hypothetical protein
MRFRDWAMGRPFRARRCPMTDDRNRTTPRGDPLARPEDPGAYIGHEPEREAETIPGGVRHDDERIAASASQSGARSPDTGEVPEGHREGPDADDDAVREAGENR